MSPTMAPLVNSLADERVRGQANSLSGMANSLALIASPAIVTGVVVGAAAVWIGLLCLGCLGTVAISARLRRRLTAEQDRADAPGERAPGRPSPACSVCGPDQRSPQCADAVAC